MLECRKSLHIQNLFRMPFAVKAIAMKTISNAFEWQMLRLLRVSSLMSVFTTTIRTIASVSDFFRSSCMRLNSHKEGEWIRRADNCIFESDSSIPG